MGKIRMGVAASLIAAFGLSVSAGASQKQDDKPLSPDCKEYVQLYDKVDKENAGPYKGGLAGRNIVENGVNDSPVRPATASDCAESNGVMERMLNPVAVVAESSVSTEAATSSGGLTGTGQYSIPEYIVQCESGGDYNAQNPSGAYGAYQIMPGTAAAYGCDLSTVAGQDQCAAEIYAAEGSAPWVCG